LFTIFRTAAEYFLYKWGNLDIKYFTVVEKLQFVRWGIVQPIHIKQHRPYIDSYQN